MIPIIVTTLTLSFSSTGELYSPDLNPVEQIGNHIKRQFWLFSPNEDKQLLYSLVAFKMHSRYQAVIEANGHHTRY